MSADKKAKSSATLPPCAICNTKIAIYRCPRCHKFTCSLECCRIHKKTDACDGKRDRTQFCSVNRFTDSQLSSDYHFLEDVLKVSESSKRMYQGIVTDKSSSSSVGGPTKRGRVQLDSISTKVPDHPLLQAKKGKSIAQILANGTADGDDNMQTDTTTHNAGNVIINELFSNNNEANPIAKSQQTTQKREKVDPLTRQAEMKGIHLLRMPSGMMRHKSNTTKFNKKKGTITWKLELCFHNNPKDTHESEGCEKKPNGTLLPKLLKVESEVLESHTLSEELGKHLDVHPGNSMTRSQLRAFASITTRESLLFFMKRLPCSSSNPQYYKLDHESTLKDILVGKTIIEFPTIDVVMESDKDRFPVFIGEVT